MEYSVPTGIRAGDSSAKVGGPAVVAQFSWINTLLSYCKSSSLPNDFVSWHHYDNSYGYGDYGSEISTVRTYLANNGCSDVEMIVSEWNLNNAAHCGMVLDQFKTYGLSKNLFFMAKDYDEGSELFGGWGAITYTNKPKPAYNFFKAYSKLVGNRVGVTGSGDSVKAFAVQDGNTLRILAWYFDPEVPFGTAQPVNLTVNLAGSTLPTGQFARMIWLIDRTHSNVGYDADNSELTQVQQDKIILSSSTTWSFKFRAPGLIPPSFRRYTFSVR
jgi:hypothetical protein